MQILQTDLHTFPKELVERICSKIKVLIFLLGDHFIDSHNLSLYSVWIIARRKLVLDTIGT